MWAWKLKYVSKLVSNINKSGDGYNLTKLLLTNSLTTF